MDAVQLVNYFAHSFDSIEEIIGQSFPLSPMPEAKVICRDSLTRLRIRRSALS